MQGVHRMPPRASRGDASPLYGRRGAAAPVPASPPRTSVRARQAYSPAPKEKTRACARCPIDRLSAPGAPSCRSILRTGHGRMTMRPSRRCFERPRPYRPLPFFTFFGRAEPPTAGRRLAVFGLQTLHRCARLGCCSRHHHVEQHPRRRLPTDLPVRAPSCRSNLGR